MSKLRKELIQRAAIVGRGCCVTKKMLYNKTLSFLNFLFYCDLRRGDAEKLEYHMQVHFRAEEVSFRYFPLNHRCFQGVTGLAPNPPVASELGTRQRGCPLSLWFAFAERRAVPGISGCLSELIFAVLRTGLADLKRYSQCR